MTAQTLRYLVKWQGYPESENSWEPMAQFRRGGKGILRDYHEKEGLRVYKWMY